MVFDSTTPPTYCKPPPPPQIRHVCCIRRFCLGIANAVILLRFSRPLPVTPLRQAAWRTSRKSTCDSKQLDGCVIVALDDTYIINYLELKGYPGISDERQVGRPFSYTVKVSRDKANWLELFDYSSFACRGAQHLSFPKQAAR